MVNSALLTVSSVNAMSLLLHCHRIHNLLHALLPVGWLQPRIDGIHRTAPIESWEPVLQAHRRRLALTRQMPRKRMRADEASALGNQPRQHWHRRQAAQVRQKWLTRML